LTVFSVVEMKQNSCQEEGARALGSGKIHIVRTEKRAFVVPAREFEEALRMSSTGLEFSGRWPDVSPYLPNFLLPLCMFGVDFDLEVLIHCLKTPPRSTRLGTLQLRGGRILFNGVELSEDVFEQGEKTLWKWLDTCMDRAWEDWTFDQERATELARLVEADLREAERRSLETLRRTLGDEVVNQLLRERRITVRSRNGGEYTITDSGWVLTSSGRHVCVEVAGEGRLPRYDVVLAKYLVIRDHPEQIETLGETSPLERERERLRGEIAALQAELATLKGRLAMLDG